jgi:hypothetical protein
MGRLVTARVRNACWLRCVRNSSVSLIRKIRPLRAVKCKRSPMIFWVTQRAERIKSEFWCRGPGLHRSLGFFLSPRRSMMPVDLSSRILVDTLRKFFKPAIFSVPGQRSGCATFRSQPLRWYRTDICDPMKRTSSRRRARGELRPFLGLEP